MLEYNLVGALTKLMLLRYSRKGLKPSLFVELEYQDLKQENFDQMVKKAVDVKAKAVFWLRFNKREIDQSCPHDN